jgi:predicted nucleotidyltransferase
MVQKKNIEDFTSIILPILKAEGVLRSAFFGSFVRGEDTPDSDIDILVELPEEKSLLDLITLEFKLEDALQRDVDVVTYRSLNPRLLPYIEREQVQIL